MKEQIEEKEIKQKNNNKKTLIVSIIGVLVLIIAVVGITYAAWNYVFNGSLTNTLQTADISLELLESEDNIINITNALPMSDNEGKLEQAFDFVVTSKTTRDIDIEYTINIEKLTVDNGYTSLNDNQIKVYLTDEAGTQKLAPTLISNLTNYKLYKGTHSHDSTHNKVQNKFKLRVWIDSAVDASSWNLDTKLQYKFKIGVNGEEKQPSAYPEYVYRYGTNTVVNGEPLEQTTATKWVASMDGFVYVKEDTQAACEEKKLVYGISDACTQESVSWGIGTYTEDYTTLNKTFFLKHNISNEGTVESSEVCFIRNNTLYCLKGEGATYNSETHQYNNDSIYYQDNENLILEAFGPNAVENNVCSVSSYGVYCSASGLDAFADQGGNVDAYDGSSDCVVDAGGVSNCGG